jgi:hypothetical protein
VISQTTSSTTIQQSSALECFRISSTETVLFDMLVKAMSRAKPGNNSSREFSPSLAETRARCGSCGVKNCHSGLLLSSVRGGVETAHSPMRAMVPRARAETDHQATVLRREVSESSAIFSGHAVIDMWVRSVVTLPLRLPRARCSVYIWAASGKCYQIRYWLSVPSITVSQQSPT